MLLILVIPCLCWDNLIFINPALTRNPVIIKRRLDCGYFLRKFHNDETFYIYLNLNIQWIISINTPVSRPCAGAQSIINITRPCAGALSILNITRPCAETLNIINITRPCAETLNIINITRPCAETLNIINITRPCAGTLSILNITRSCAETFNIVNVTRLDIGLHTDNRYSANRRRSRDQRGTNA